MGHKLYTSTNNGIGEQWRNTTTMGFPDMVIVGAGFRPVSDWVWLIMQLLRLDEVDISLVWGNI